jgi:hypothetical protein
VRDTDCPPGARPAHLGLSGARRLKGPSPSPGGVSAPGESGPVDSRRSSRARNQARGRGPAARTPSPQADPSLPPGQPRRMRNAFMQTAATFEAGHRAGRARCTRQQATEQVAPGAPASPVLADKGQTGGWTQRLQPKRPVRTRPVVVLDRDRQDLLQVATADDLACCSFAIRCPHPSGSPLGVRRPDRAAGRCACRSRHEPARQPGRSAHQAATPRRLKVVRYAAGARRAGRSRFERQSQ